MIFVQRKCCATMPNLPPIHRIATGLGQAAALALIPLSALAESASVELASQAGEAVDDGAFVTDFSDLFAPDRNDSGYVADFARAAEHFRTAWSKDQIRQDPQDGALVIDLVPTAEGHAKDFISGQVQVNEPRHFGRYEVVMQAAKGDGIVSSFYTYTGPWYGDPHDEIEFECLGRDTTKVWINRFVDGQRLPGKWLDLGFDAGDAPHHYAFDWQPDSLTWYVDGEEFFKIAAPEHAIPQTAGKIFVDVWAGGEPAWVGATPADMRTAARYYCMSYRPTGSLAPTCSLPEGGPAHD